MKKSIFSLLFVCSFSLFGMRVIPYNGKLSSDGINFDGSAEFAFSIVDEDGEILWSHANEGQAITIQVAGGIYSVLLGGQGMNPVPTDLFISDKSLFLRIKADLGSGKGLQLLSPDQPITAVPIAMSAYFAELSDRANSAVVADSVKAGAITSEMLSSNVLSQLSTLETLIEEINVELFDSEPDSIARNMLSDSLQQELDSIASSINDLESASQEIENESITLEMLSSDLRGRLVVPKEETASDELLNGWVREEYATIGKIIPNGNGGFALLHDDEGDGLSLENYEANGTEIFSAFFYAQDDDWTLMTQSSDAVATADGGFLLLGESDAGQIEDKSDAGFGSEDFWLIKLDSEGNLEWDASFGGSDSDTYPHGAQFSNGNYLVAGNSYSAVGGNKEVASVGGQDVWVVCLDQEGQKVWEKAFGGTDNETVEEVVVLSDGSALIAVTTDSDASGNMSAANKGLKDVWLIKIDADGNKIWDKTYGGDGDDEVRSVVVLDDGGFIFSASTDSSVSGDVGEEVISQDAADVWLVKVNGQGAKVWEVRENDEVNLDTPDPHVSLSGGSLHLVYYVYDDNDDELNVYVNLDLDGNIISRKYLELDWEYYNFASLPVLVPVEDGFIFYDVYEYEIAHFNSNLDSLLLYAKDIADLGEMVPVNLEGGSVPQNSIIFDDLGSYINSAPPRFRDFYNHDDYLYLVDPDNDPVWSDPQNPDVRLVSEEGRTVERYLAGWAYDGYGADPDSDEDGFASAPMVDRAFLIPKLTIKGLGPLVVEHTLLDASAKSTAVSDQTEYSYTGEFYDEWLDEDVPALWQTAPLKSSILNLPEELAFTHILDSENNTIGLQLIKGIDASTELSEGLVLSREDVATNSQVELFNGFPDGARVELTLDYAIYMGWVSDGGWWMPWRKVLSKLEGNIEDGYIAEDETYKPVP